MSAGANPRPMAMCLRRRTPTANSSQSPTSGNPDYTVEIFVKDPKRTLARASSYRASGAQQSDAIDHCVKSSLDCKYTLVHLKGLPAPNLQPAWDFALRQRRPPPGQYCQNQLEVQNWRGEPGEMLPPTLGPGPVKAGSDVLAGHVKLQGHDEGERIAGWQEWHRVAVLNFSGFGELRPAATVIP